MFVIFPHEDGWIVADRDRSVRFSMAEIDSSSGDAGRVRSMLKEVGFHGREAWISLPRTSAVLRYLEVPRVSESDVSELVSLQLETLSNGNPEGMVSDFVLLPDRHSDFSEMDRVLTVSVSKSVVEESVGFWTAAGLKVAGVSVGSLSLARLDRTECDCCLIVSGGSEGVDVVVGCHRVPFNALSIRCDFNNPQLAVRQIQSAAARLLVNLPKGISSQPKVVYFAMQHEQREIAKLLQDEMKLPVSLVDEVPSLGQLPFCTIARCLLNSVHEKVPPVNLAFPRKSRSGRGTILGRYGRSAVAAILLASLGGALWFDEAMNLDEKLQRRRQRYRELQKLIDRGAPFVATEVALQDWRRGQIPWSQTLDEFGKSMPDRNSVILNRLACEVSQASGLPVIRATGFVREPNDVLKWQERLLADPDKYELQPHGIESNPLDPEFQARFDIEATIKAVPEVQRTPEEPSSNPKALAERKQ